MFKNVEPNDFGACLSIGHVYIQYICIPEMENGKSSYPLYIVVIFTLPAGKILVPSGLQMYV